jgi:hypothetical protein
VEGRVAGGERVPVGCTHRVGQHAQRAQHVRALGGGGVAGGLCGECGLDDPSQLERLCEH